MTDLHTFLLARLSDDQERAEFVARQIEGNNWAPSEPWKLSWHDEYDLLCIEPSRVFAEVAAKRAIVEALGNFDDALVWDAATGLRAESALFALASVYADHDEFDAEWSL